MTSFPHPGDATMIRLVTATLAGLYIVALTAGRDLGPETGRAAPDTDLEIGGITLVSAAEAAIPAELLAAPEEEDETSISDSEAVRLALAAGAEFRSDRSGPVLLGMPGAAPETVAADAASERPGGPLWRVTGNRVNLRAGPGTGNDVVAQLDLGTQAAVIGEDGGWYRIETADGAVSGWIFGRYLEQQG